jgi:hypothetical protein
MGWTSDRWRFADFRLWFWHFRQFRRRDYGATIVTVVRRSPLGLADMDLIDVQPGVIRDLMFGFCGLIYFSPGVQIRGADATGDPLAKLAASS